ALTDFLTQSALDPTILRYGETEQRDVNAPEDAGHAGDNRKATQRDISFDHQPYTCRQQPQASEKINQRRNAEEIDAKGVSFSPHTLAIRFGNRGNLTHLATITRRPLC